jgi:hypothetical protein
VAACVSTAGFGMSEVAAMAPVGDAAGNETKCTSAIRLEEVEGGVVWLFSVEEAVGLG